jgi:hypothetical protein
VCEKGSVGRYGSPGRVQKSEILHSVLIGPSDLKGDQIAITVVTHAEKKGMSVLRDAASNDEFKKIIAERTKNNSARWVHGVASIPCAKVRSLLAKSDTGQRHLGDRLYSVLDADMDGLPCHADIFATVPRQHGNKTPKEAWRVERGRLMELMLDNVSGPSQFRNGVLASEAPGPPPR